eukprot:268965-Prymnesium_polylepis.2
MWRGASSSAASTGYGSTTRHGVLLSACVATPDAGGCGGASKSARYESSSCSRSRGSSSP